MPEASTTLFMDLSLQVMVGILKVPIPRLMTVFVAHTKKIVWLSHLAALWEVAVLAHSLVVWHP